MNGQVYQLTCLLTICSLIGSDCKRTNGKSTHVLEKTVKDMYNGVYGDCRKPVSPKQIIMCKKVAGMKNVTSKAADSAIAMCNRTFMYEPWNCSFSEAKPKTKEEGYLYSLVGASITYWGTRGCREGWFARCPCGKGINKADTRKALKNGICPPNVKYATRIVKKFMGVSRRFITQTDQLLKNHNYLLGIQVLKDEMKISCKCLGIYGTCYARVCWKDLPDLKNVAAKLKLKYYSSLKLSANQRISEKGTLKKSKRKIVYVNDSQDFCETASGRKCIDPKNCLRLCCDRGFDRIIEPVDVHCNCTYVPKSLKVNCDVCQSSLDHYICK